MRTKLVHSKVQHATLLCVHTHTWASWSGTPGTAVLFRTGYSSTSLSLDLEVPVHMPVRLRRQLCTSTFAQEVDGGRTERHALKPEL